MPDKIGVYIDEAAIKPLLNAEELAEFVQTRFSGECPVVRTHPMLNTNAGRDQIQKDIDDGLIDSVCICAGSPRVDGGIFDFGPAILVERVNLREQCVKCYKNPDGTVPVEGEEIPLPLKDMAEDYIKMGVIKLTKTKIPAPEMTECNTTIMVLGGGFTGLNAALYAARANQKVVLVEKEEALGGKAAKLLKTFPMNFPYTRAHEVGLEEIIEDVTANENITVMTSTELKNLKGAPGMYTAELATGEEATELEIGSVVLATGWTPGDAEYLAPLGYGKYANVVTSAEFEAMAKEGKIARPSDGKAPKTVAFLLNVENCVQDLAAPAIEACEPQEELPEPAEGEEGEQKFEYKSMESSKHLAYSSEISSLVALKQAQYVREADDEALAYVLYDNMMIPGINEKYYKVAQDEPGIMLSKATVSEVMEDRDKNLIIVAGGTLLGKEVDFQADMVVVPTSLVPVTANAPTINLEYRQGPAFPDLDLFDGFADSNYICFPYETRRTGIYAAGCVRQPMTLASCREDAAGAALKAIQCVNSANHGVAVHPRSGDNSYPVFNFGRCTQCKRCTEECPFGALDDDETGTPKPNPSRCRRCGTCMGACPERVISFDNYNIDQVGSAIKQIRVPDDMDAEGPRIIVLACENDAYPAIDMAAMRGSRWSPYVRFLSIRCLGSVNAIWVADAMSKGIDGVMLLGCKYGEDYQCHFVKGSELCKRRSENIADTLNRLGVEPERVVQEEVAIDEYNKVSGLIDNFVDYILKIGPNPFKGY
ncbi:MAG: hydrogenase iron-sulfur subunit [Desulfovibrio sp.]